MKYSIFFVLLLLLSCHENEEEKFRKSCPYELDYDGHFLKIPISITPHQLQYHVGDTININTVFSDSIYDLGTHQTFKIERFPFKPVSLLFRFTASDSYDSGYRVNELKIDSIYNHVYGYSSIYADGYRAYTIYDDDEDQYRFESELILKKPGRYVLVFSDLYQSYNGSGNEGMNAEANAVTFEGQCPTLPYYLCSMIDSGSDHLSSFEEELIYLDENVYRGKLRFNRNPTGALGGGALSVEFGGFFGFEVVE